MLFNTPSACGGVIPLNTGPGLALGFNTLYYYLNRCNTDNKDPYQAALEARTKELFSHSKASYG